MTTIQKLKNNQYLVTVEGRTVKFDIDGVCFGLGGGKVEIIEREIEIVL